MRYFMTLLFVLLAYAVFAQNDPKAKEILDKAAAKFKAYPAAEIDFTLTMENPSENIHEMHEGKAWMKGNLYKLNVMDVENYYDGKNIYTYMPEVQEVNIKNPNEEEEEMLNPTTLFDIHNQGFDQKLVSTGNDITYIELFPTDKSRNFTKIGILQLGHFLDLFGLLGFFLAGLTNVGKALGDILHAVVDVLLDVGQGSNGFLDGGLDLVQGLHHVLLDLLGSGTGVLFQLPQHLAELAGVLGQLIGADDHEGHDGHQDQLCKTNFHSVPIPFLSHNRHPLRPAVLLLHRGCGAVCAFVALCIPEVCELQMNLF